MVISAFAVHLSQEVTEYDVRLNGGCLFHDSVGVAFRVQLQGRIPNTMACLAGAMVAHRLCIPGMPVQIRRKAPPHKRENSANSAGFQQHTPRKDGAGEWIHPLS